ncbi:hypothetical protein QBC47DRAFT_356831 [Echria macrotheca]|uniref:ABM domain-containing protein n=1 Tax=Echria macrotheca TaxID=438768 RepID=A0AAJ0F8B7_9PEZI|nr:hypothetical protein QBC47DRAFT_356831 [Echria macrotheca]
MPYITEFAWFPVKADADGSEAAVAFKNLRPELYSQPGMQGAWSGAPLEKPQSREFVNSWDSEANYITSQDSPIHTQAKKLMGQLIDRSDPAVKPYHNAVALSKPFEVVAAAPVVQVSSFFLPADVDKAAFEAAFNKVLSQVYDSPPDGYVVGANGWALEDVNGAKVFATVTGWESVEKRMAAHAAMADKFGEVQKFTTVVEVHHTSFNKIA